MLIYPHKSKALLVILVIGLASGSVAWAGLDLPETDCDSAQGVNNLVLSSSVEDGTQAFKYGEDNQTFASKTDLVVTLSFDLLFTANDDTTIKVYFMNSNCFVVAGLAFQQFFPEENIFTYDINTDKLSINGADPLPIFPNGLPRYLWIEVLDIHPDPTLTSYSYLVDMNDIQNPVVAEEEEQPEEGGGSETEESTGLRPVLIIPGIMGTELYDDDQLIWPDIDRLLVNPNDGFLSEALVLNENGDSIKDIIAGDVIKDIVVKEGPIVLSNTDTFTGLINILEQEGYELNQTLFFFPYDWRVDLNLTRSLLNEKVEEIKNQTGFEKIDIIAHSMGGLLTENYIKSYDTDSIDKLIFVGTPHLGSPKSASVLISGDLGIGVGPINFVRAERIKEISINSPSIYQLLPNPKYFEVYQGYINLVPDGGVMDYSQSMSILAQMDKNPTLLDRADVFFGQGLYNLDYEEIQVSNIVGCKRASTRDFFIINQENRKFIGHRTSNGDGTVPFISADYSSGTAYYVKNGKHSELPSAEGVRQLIAGILNGSEVLASNISTTPGFCPINGKELNWRSPVEVHIYDSLGNHAGPDGDRLIEENIAGVVYEIIDEEAYIFLPTDEGQVYTIEATGTADSSFDLIISNIENDEVTSNTLFDNVHIIPGTSISFTVSGSTEDTEIIVDNNVVSASSHYSDPEEALVQAVSTPPDDPTPSVGGGGGITPMPEPVSEPEPDGGKILGEAISRIPDGTLVLDIMDQRTVYIIGNDGKRYGFASEESFLGLGFHFEWIEEADLTSYEFAGLIKYPDEIHPNGSLVTDGQTIWFINFEKRQVVDSSNFDTKKLIKINQADYLLEEK